MRNTLSKAFFLVFLLLLSAAIGQADFLVVPAAAFHSYVTEPSDLNYVTTECNSRWIFTKTQPPGGYCYAPVNLPDGVRIDGIVLFFRDNHGVSGIELQLFKNYQLNETISASLFSVKTSGQSTEVQSLGDWTIDEGTRIVNNNSFQYTLRIKFGAASEELKCFGAKIKYTPVI
jgi:hypothetical protein